MSPHSDPSPNRLRRLLPLLVLAALLALAALALLNPPSAQRSEPDLVPQLTVETVQVRPRDYQVVADSFGTVQPRTQSRLVSQVGGEVVWVSPQFRDGGVFAAGDTLLRIDDRDYAADVQIARAQLFAAQQALAEEQALSQQALADWQRLGAGEEADELVLRKPQLRAAQARVASAQAELRKAELSLERTAVVAPFAGRILSTAVDLGEVIGSSSQLAQIYASDYVEIRLPLANADLEFVNLPEPGPPGTENAGSTVEVSIHSSLSGSHWPGRLVRTEAAIDSSARQLHVVAQVDDPFGLQRDTGRKPLKIGEYVTASIAGRHLEDAIVIPNSTIYQGAYVYLVREGLLQRQAVQVAWQNESDAVIAGGLQAGDELVTTTLGQVTSGTPVRVQGRDRTLVEGAAGAPDAWRASGPGPSRGHGGARP
ncbi:MAG: efflux transporter periplasmic adaptor subunit [Halioglobus sp.]|nr:efflux transporter periplasmic adaptor subunit [Halioglobus sp.]